MLQGPVDKYENGVFGCGFGFCSCHGAVKDFWWLGCLKKMERVVSDRWSIYLLYVLGYGASGVLLTLESSSAVSEFGMRNIHACSTHG